MEGKITKETLPEGILGIVLVYSLLRVVGSLIPYYLFEFALFIDVVLKPAGGIGLMIMVLITMRKRVSRKKGIIVWWILFFSFLAPWFSLFILIDQDPFSIPLSYIIGVTLLGVVIGTDMQYRLPNNYRIVAYPLALINSLTSSMMIQYLFVENTGISTFNPLVYYLKQATEIIFWGGLFYLIQNDKLFIFSREEVETGERESIIGEDLLFPDTKKQES
ncbi:MAG: hypothetical protein D6732_23845 [Methanobacteriota archaeon]|nr:MAG: hypothetical protein D6732_23845 [Euryarchaeota archaeon]